MLMWSIAASASQRDYGADYTDDAHSSATRTTVEPAPTQSPSLSAGPSEREAGLPQPEQSATLSRQLRARRPPGVPRRGMSKQSVRSAFGPPLTIQGAVGQPPITRWNYAAFHVYFEYNRVIHSVIPDHPAPIDHAAQLK